MLSAVSYHTTACSYFCRLDPHLALKIRPLLLDVSYYSLNMPVDGSLLLNYQHHVLVNAIIWGLDSATASSRKFLRLGAFRVQTLAFHLRD